MKFLDQLSDRGIESLKALVFVVIGVLVVLIWSMFL